MPLCTRHRPEPTGDIPTHEQIAELLAQDAAGLRRWLRELGFHQEADDAIGEAVLTALTGMRPVNQLRPWFWSTVLGNAKRLRKPSGHMLVEPSVLNTLGFTEADKAEDLEPNALLQFVQQEMEGLSPRQRAVLGCISRGLSFRETAEELGISASAVNTHLAAARTRIVSRLSVVLDPTSE